MYIYIYTRTRIYKSTILHVKLIRYLHDFPVLLWISTAPLPCPTARHRRNAARRQGAPRGNAAAAPAKLERNLEENVFFTGNRW